MSDKAEEKIPTCTLYSVEKRVYALDREDAIILSFAEHPGPLHTYQMSLKEAWQLENSLSEPSITKTPPYALESENTISIFLNRTSEPNFQMTPEGASHSRRLLLQELPPIE